MAVGSEQQAELDRALLDSTDIMGTYEKHLRSELATDPYAVYQRYRAEAPVHHGDVLVEEFGLTASMGSAGGTRDVFSIFGYDEVLEVLKNPQTFSNSAYRETLGETYGGRNLVFSDPPEHTWLRRMVQASFSKSEISRWTEQVVLPTVDDYVDVLAGLGRAELMSEMVLTFPATVIAKLLNLPLADTERFRQLGTGLMAFHYMPDVAMACSRQVTALFDQLADVRTDDPGTDLVSICLAAKDPDGNSLQRKDLLSFLNVLLPAGSDTTARGLGALLVGLLSDPEQLDYVNADPGRIPIAAEEALRWEPPVQYVYRIARTDTELGGVRIPAGAALNVCLGSANRDETQFENADRFDVRRPDPSRSSLTFAGGVHICLGIQLARIEIAAAARALLERLPDLRLDPSEEPPHLVGTTFRSVTAVPVVWGG